MAKEELSLMNEPFHDELAVCSVHSQPRHPPTAFVMRSLYIGIGMLFRPKNVAHEVEDGKQLAASKHGHAYVYGIDLDSSASKQP